MNDYRCLNGHPFSSPDGPHGGPWSTLVCPRCGATSHLELPAGFVFPQSVERGCDASGKEAAHDSLGQPAQHDAPPSDESGPS